MKNKINKIISVEENSIGQELGVQAGDVLLEINNNEIIDVFDYRYFIREEYIEILIQKPSGEEWLLEIEKEENEDLGFIFESGLMDTATSCNNKCIFCFIDQLPKGMRETLYFKDDDIRLSFLSGNYVTLTNIKEEDLNRIIFYHLSPINISVHTTDLELRKKMLHNKNSSNILEYIEKLANANISMNFQVVLVKGVNDGKSLDKTIMDLSVFFPKAKSLSIVPIGITKFRDNLFPAEPFNREDAITVLEQIHGFQKLFKKEYKTNFVFAADEFYLKAQQPMPDYKDYEDFPQIENGVGMIAELKRSFITELKKASYKGKNKKISIVTGKAAYNCIKTLSDNLCEKFSNINIMVYPVTNNFFGENITVSGLLTGKDIMECLKGKDLGEYVLIPENALKADQDIFLDDVTVQQLEEALYTKVVKCAITGKDFIRNVLCEATNEKEKNKWQNQ